jgi:hypothetical protein
LARDNEPPSPMRMLNPFRYISAAFCALALAATATAQVAAPYCFGTSCPCGNDDDLAGCGNSGLDGDPATGALLEGFGSADVLRDDLVLRVSGVKPGAFGLIFMGAAAIQVPFGDGQRCVGAGGVGTFRFPARQTTVDGAYLEHGLVARSQGFAAGAIRAGSTWYFQGWFRDSQGPCGSGFNLSNGLPVTFGLQGSDGPVEVQLAGRPLATYPFFEYSRAFNQGSDLYVSLDPAQHPALANTSTELYVVAAKTDVEWQQDARLIDVRGSSQALNIGAPGVQANSFLIDAGTLNGTEGTGVGIGYDLVLDVDRDGELGAGDLVDGLSVEAGAYVVRDVTLPGPHAVSQIMYSGGSFLQQTTYFPTDVASMDKLPLVVVSHGNGHDYRWYDHIGFHMASYGYVVMSHRNNTVPGSHAAATTTITNTEYFLRSLPVIEGGALLGHVDSHRITWIGHSRGADGVVRAYHRMFTGNAVPTGFDVDDIVLISSIAPVDFGGPQASNPHGANFHLWTGSADADVNGGPNSDAVQTFHLLDRATGTRLATTLHGAGHGVFHDGGGSFVANGPCLNGRVRVHNMMRGYLVPLLAHFVRDDIPSKDFLWRQWEGFSPIGSPAAHDCVSVQLEYVDGPQNGNFVIDDFQSESGPDVSSSGGSVTFTVQNVVEGLLNDANTSFSHDLDDAMNGMTRARANDTTRGVVFDWDAPSYYELSLPPAERDLRAGAYLSLKACQAARHPNTEAELGDLTFTVTLRDALGRTSSISIGATGGGVEEPYQRTGAGTGAGWANEFETQRIRLTDFLSDGVQLDLGHIKAVRLEFGGASGSSVGRIGIDDIEITKD